MKAQFNSQQMMDVISGDEAIEPVFSIGNINELHKQSSLIEPFANNEDKDQSLQIKKSFSQNGNIDIKDKTILQGTRRHQDNQNENSGGYYMIKKKGKVSSSLNKSQTARKVLVFILDVIGFVGLIIYSLFLKSFFSTFYFMMSLIIMIHFWQKKISSVGFFDQQCQKKKILSLKQFDYLVNDIKNIPNKGMADVSENQDEISSFSSDQRLLHIKYLPKFWFIYQDYQRLIQGIILLFSSITLIVKIVLIIVINAQPEAILQMEQYNFDGLEVYCQKIENRIKMTGWDYSKSLIPNILIIVYFAFAVFTKRPRKRELLENFQFNFFIHIHKIMMIIIWILLVLMICTTQNLIGYIFYVFQIVFTMKIFIRKSPPNSIDINLCKSLLIYQFIVLIIIYFFATQYGQNLVKRESQLFLFLGFDIFIQFFNGESQNIIYIIATLFLFNILCITITNSCRELLRRQFSKAIQECIINREEFVERDKKYQEYLNQKRNQIVLSSTNIKTQSFEKESLADIVDAQLDQNIVNKKEKPENQKDGKNHSILRLSKSLIQFLEKTRIRLDNPLITLRVLQITSILIILQLKTYFSLGLVFWVLFTGISLDLRLNYYTSIIFAIPSLICNQFTFYYKNIPGLQDQENDYNICFDSKIDQKQSERLTTCSKLGFIQIYYAYIIVLLLNATLCGFILLIKQIFEQRARKIQRTKRRAQGFQFLMSKEQKLDKVSYFTIFIASLLKASYVISLFILFWVGFYTVNAIQFIMVILLLVFLINNSQSIAQKKKSKVQQNDQEKLFFVTFTFRYWIIVVIYVSCIILATQFYTLFFENQDYVNQLSISIIGLNQDSDYETLIWILFYFISLQYDSYRSKIYRKYSNHLMELIMRKPLMKKYFPSFLSNYGFFKVLIMKSMIWISFAFNFGCLIFTPFSYLNSILLSILLLLFVYYVRKHNQEIPYSFVRKIWYIYLNLQVIIFFVRYIFQFICVPPYENISSNQTLSWVYSNLKNYQEFGFYKYQMEGLRQRFLPDTLSIIFGSISLSIFTVFLQCQSQIKMQSNQQSEQLNFSNSNSYQNSRILDIKKLEEIKQIASYLDIQILDKIPKIKKFFLCYACFNIDLITLIIIFTAVFWLKSVVIVFYLVLYLGSIWKLNQNLLSRLEQNRINEKIKEQILGLKNQYTNLDKIEKPLDNNEQNLNMKLQQLMIDIRETKANEKFQLRVKIWKYSFYLAAFCIFITYCSQALSGHFIKSNANSDEIRVTQILLFIFGTYSNQEVPDQNYCGLQERGQQSSEEKTTSILSRIWIYLLLLLINVVENVTIDVLLKEKQKLRQIELDIQQSQAIKIEKQQVMKVSQDILGEIKEDVQEEVEFYNNDIIKYEEDDQNDKQNLIQFQKDFSFVQFKQREQQFENQDLEKEEHFNQINSNHEKSQIQSEDYLAKKYALIINFYKSKDFILTILFQEAVISFFIRFLIFLFLMNTLFATNILTPFYCLTAAYLFEKIQKNKTVKLLNTYLIISIFLQYVLFIIDYEPQSNMIPENFKMKSNQFSLIQLIGLKNIYWRTYLGFTNGPLQDCQKLKQLNGLFQNFPCFENPRQGGILILNTFLILLINLYFSFIQHFTAKLLRTEYQINRNLQKSETIIRKQLLLNQIIKIDYKLWKSRGYILKNNLHSCLINYGNILLQGIILLIMVGERTLFNLIFIFLCLIFFSLTCFKMVTSKLQAKFFQTLFFIPVVTIICNTLLKIPVLLNFCGSQTFRFDQGQTQTDTSQSTIFFCQQIYSIKITDILIIMFGITLYFDMNKSDINISLIKKKQKLELLQSRMIAKALAYQLNYDKYKEILKVQEQKNVFKQIQQMIMNKLNLWHQKMKSSDYLEQKNQNNTDQIQENDNQDYIADQNIFEELYIENNIEQKEDKEDSSRTLNRTQRQLKKIIRWLENKNLSCRFLGHANLLNFILAQNQKLQRHVYITLNEYLQEDFDIFKKEMDFLELFYGCVYKNIVKDQKINSNLIRQVIDEQNIQFGQTSQQNPSVLKKMEEQKQIFTSYSDYRSSKDLTFVHIYDPDERLELFNTKKDTQILQQDQKKTSYIYFLLFREFGRYLSSRWENICFILIILYFLENSGIFGGILPVILFLWVIIEEKQSSKWFWYFAYIWISITIIILFTVTLEGMVFEYPQTINYSIYQPWYNPLFNRTHTTLIFEVILIWLIIYNSYLRTKWGLYNNDLLQIENLFRAYVRMKINYFNKEMKKELEEEKENKQEQDSLVDLIDNKPKNTKIRRNTIIRQRINLLEERILEDPLLLKSNINYNFFQRTFAYKFSKPGVDYYINIASCQIVILLYLLFFFSAMTRNGSNIDIIFSTNQIPGEQVLILLAQIIVMIIERYIVLMQPNIKTFTQEQINTTTIKKPSFLLTILSKVKEIFHLDHKPTKLSDNKLNLSINLVETNQNELKKENFTSTYRIQFILKYLLQITLLTLVYLFVFLYVGQPWERKTKISDENVLITINENYSSNMAVRFFFIIYCIYFYLSALQLKQGFREVKLRNVLLTKFNQLSSFTMKVYYAIPFLYELKVLMDWTFLKTSLDVFQWFKLENIHSILFFSKMQSKAYLNRKVGNTVRPFMKCSMGCSLVLFILMCIFGPLVLFSTLNPSTNLNVITGGNFQIQLHNINTDLIVTLYETNQLYGLENRIHNQDQINKAFHQDVTNEIINQAPSVGALQQFQLMSFSETSWQINEPFYNLLLNQINATLNEQSQDKFFLNITYTLFRQEEFAVPKKTTFSYPANPILQAYPGQNLTGLDNQTLRMIYNNIAFCSSETINLQNFYVEAIQIYTTDGVKFQAVPLFGEGIQSVDNVTMALYCGQDSLTPLLGQSWWNFTYSGTSQNINKQGSQGLLFFVVSDRYSPLTIGFSIITIYTSVILLIGSFIRGLFSGQVQLIQYKDMTKPDDLLMICEAITIARSQKDFQKEHMLYFELIDLLRSPEILKVMTGSWSETYRNLQNQQNNKLKLD